MESEVIAQPPQKPSSKKKLFLIIGLSILVVAIVGAGTFFLLQTFVKTPAEPVAETTVPLKEVAAPEKIISAYQETLIKERAANYVQRTAVASGNEGVIVEENNSTPPTNSTVFYKSSKSFNTTVATTEYVQYEKKDKASTANDEALMTQTKAFLKSQGLQETKTDTSIKNVTYTNYDSINVYCQVTDFSDNTTPTNYGVACVLKTLMAENDTQIDDLLKLYPTDLSPVSAKVGLKVTEGTNWLRTIEVSLADSAKVLIYATQSETWEYIGERPVTNPDDEKSFALSTELKTAISDPKWNGFLSKYIR